MTADPLPGYDAWKLADPVPTRQPNKRPSNRRHTTRPRTICASRSAPSWPTTGAICTSPNIRRVVIEELNKLIPRAGEPTWQTATPVPLPPLG